MKKILVFAPHNDDEILGVGGTIAKFVDSGCEVYVCEVTHGDYNNEIEKNLTERTRKEALESHKLLGVKQTFFLDLPVVALKDTPTLVINAEFEKIVSLVKPNIVFIPHRGDMHIDHRETAYAAMVSLRPISNPQLEAIYAYETLSETEWNTPTVDNAFIPNCYNDISNFIDLKLKSMACFKSQLHEFPHPRSLEAIEALSKYRGSTIGVNNAECFILIRGKNNL